MLYILFRSTTQNGSTCKIQNIDLNSWDHPFKSRFLPYKILLAISLPFLVTWFWIGWHLFIYDQPYYISKHHIPRMVIITWVIQYNKVSPLKNLFSNSTLWWAHGHDQVVWILGHYYLLCTNLNIGYSRNLPLLNKSCWSDQHFLQFHRQHFQDDNYHMVHLY